MMTSKAAKALIQTHGPQRCGLRGLARAIALAAPIALSVGSALWSAGSTAQNHAPNPYNTVLDWARLPEGRVWGSTSAVYPHPDGKHIWVAERCGANSCVGSDLDPVMLFDENGNMVRSFGAGLITWPHGINVDHEGNVWVADGVGYRAV
ncbi:MAG: hypothetical protein V2I82_00635, partial [Halieaceae bacterium]|nr:hypothetical protein [Halieaceae bacterium]